MSDMDESLIQFPTDFVLKIIGEANETFESEILSIIQNICPDFLPEHCKRQESKNARYTSLTVTVHVNSKPQLDSVYQAVGQHPRVKWML